MLELYLSVNFMSLRWSPASLACLANCCRTSIGSAVGYLLLAIGPFFKMIVSVVTSSFIDGCQSCYCYASSWWLCFPIDVALVVDAVDG